jgi:hypothetical protein
MHLPTVLGELQRLETTLAGAYRHTAEAHAAEADVHHQCVTFAGKAERRAQRLAPAVERYGRDVPDVPDRLFAELMTGERRGAAGLLRDLRDLWTLASTVEMTWTLAEQAATAGKDAALRAMCVESGEEVAAGANWLKTKLKEAAPQALLVDPPPASLARSLARTKLRGGTMLRPGAATYTFLAAVVTLGVLGVAGMATGSKMLFPSLGPIIYLLFDEPLSPRSRPRNTIVLNVLAIVFGYCSLAVFGLLHAPPVTQQGITAARIGAAALSVGLTGAAAHLAKVQHPPAGATTLIVSLGFLTRPPELAVMAVAIAALVVMAWLVNRAVGVRMPVWSSAVTPLRVPE